MNLTDNEILELSELCSALADGRLDAGQRARLSAMLADSEEARRFYVRHSGLSASLFDYAAEMQTENPDASRKTSRVIQFPVLWLRSALAAAAAIALSAGIWFLTDHDTAEAAVETDAGPVAQITGTSDCEWGGGDLQPGASVAQGRTLELNKGVAEITFDCGARIILQGPAVLDANSAWEAALRKGSLRAVVPAEAVGFRVLNSSVDVVNLGTEFAMTA